MNINLLQNFRSLKLGPGAVSKNTWSLAVIEAALGVSLFATHDDRFHFVALALMVGAFAVHHIINLIVIERHPHLALLEGAELRDYYRSSQGVMGMPDVVDMPAIENPKIAPALMSGGDEA